MNAPIRFGTDGWRARIGEDFTLPRVRRVARAVASWLEQEQVRAARIPLGYDRRFLSRDAAREAAACLAEAGHRPVVAEVETATPVVSFATRAWQAPCGLMITASHNPHFDNGIKIKMPFGGSAGEDVTGAVEAALAAQDEANAGRPAAAWKEVTGALDEGYEALVDSLVDLDLVRSYDGHVVADAMHGVAGERLARKCAGGRLRVTTIRSGRDAWFGGVAPEPAPAHLGALKDEVLKSRAACGLATDGDADRSGVIGPDGAFVSALETAAILALDLLEGKGKRAALVRNNAGTAWFEVLAEKFGVPFFNEPVGFKHIARRMLEGDVLIGAEESGGISVQGYLPERDGILINLLLLEAMARRRTGLDGLLADLRSRFGDFRYVRTDLAMAPEDSARRLKEIAARPPEAVGGMRVARADTLDGLKLTAEDRSWVLFRASGTESKVRVYAETLAPLRPEAVVAAAVDLFQGAAR